MSGREVNKDEHNEASQNVMDTDDGTTMDEALENHLLGETGSGSDVQSCTSSVLNTPNRKLSNDDGSDDDTNKTVIPMVVDEPNPKVIVPKKKWRKNLTKSQRNKMKKLLESGLPKGEARNQVLSNVVPGTPANKRSRDGDQGSAEKPDAKRTKGNLCPKERAGLSTSRQGTSKKDAIKSNDKVKGKDGVEKQPETPKSPWSKNGRSYKDVASLVKVAVVLCGFPDVQMTLEQLDLVQEALLLKIEEQRFAETKPKFTKCSYRNGYIVFTCKDKVTALWLKDVTRSIAPWKDAKLVAMDEKDIPLPDTYHAFFPMSANFDNDRIKGLLESQNDGLSTKGWKILTRTNPGNKHAEWFLNVDGESLKTLSSNNFVLNFRFGETFLRKTKTQGQIQIENEEQNKEQEDNNTLEVTGSGAKTVDSTGNNAAATDNVDDPVNEKKMPSNRGLKERSVAPAKKELRSVNRQNNDTN